MVNKPHYDRAYGVGNCVARLRADLAIGHTWALRLQMGMGERV